MQRNPTQIRLPHNYASRCATYEALVFVYLYLYLCICICVFVSVYLYLYLCVCICICKRATQPCANSGWLTIMPTAAAQHVEPNLSHILQSAEHVKNVQAVIVCTLL